MVICSLIFSKTSIKKKIQDLLFREPWAAPPPKKEMFYASVAMSPLSVHFPIQSRLSAYDNGDNEVKPEVYKSPGIYFTTEENPGTPQLGRKNCRI